MRLRPRASALPALAPECAADGGVSVSDLCGIGLDRHFVRTHPARACRESRRANRRRDTDSTRSPISHPVRLGGLTQFRFASMRASQQTVETTGHLRSNMREGRFCATLFRTGRNSLILNGEMSEWLKEHAWKACVGETLPWVRIPLSPPALNALSINHCATA